MSYPPYSAYPPHSPYMGTPLPATGGIPPSHSGVQSGFFPGMPMPMPVQASSSHGGMYSQNAPIGPGYPPVPSFMPVPCYDGFQPGPSRLPFPSPMTHQETHAPLNAGIASDFATKAPGKSGSSAVQGTVKSVEPFNASQDAELLQKAMKGFGCDEKAISFLICTRANAQRMQIKAQYQTMFGKSLNKELESKLSGNFDTLIRALMAPPDEFDAFHLRTALKGFGTDEAALIEIICTRSNLQISAAVAAYKRLYGGDLVKDVAADTSGPLKSLLVSLLQGRRDECSLVDGVKAAADAKMLFQSGEGKWGAEESHFITILATRSLPQLEATFKEYETISKISIDAALRKGVSGSLLDEMLAIVKCAKNLPAYFAERLHGSMKGLGTDDRTLVRVIVSRSEVDMVQIKDSFRNMYGQTLARFISDDTSGSYMKALLEIIGATS